MVFRDSNNYTGISQLNKTQKNKVTNFVIEDVMETHKDNYNYQVDDITSFMKSVVTKIEENKIDSDLKLEQMQHRVAKVTHDNI